MSEIMLQDADFITQFEDCSLSPDYFDHRGHIRIAWLYVDKYGPAAALEKLVAGIRRYAGSLGADDKFHYTITAALLQILEQRQTGCQAAGWQAFIELNADLLTDAQQLLLRHYRQDVLFSEAAKAGWVEPDLQPFAGA
ncbi:hypothetical protein [Aliamphritea spongicola]|uniref:hypothetical protein n=1 Tax=Aliamphritea spongicola TaxID=707589 RepID=UPI00196B8CA9|nr:hypothetical protein [Aliamphritea spongicola]MBN3563679.1 hypothetical protein [Aliamphritea spongicola]